MTTMSLPIISTCSAEGCSYNHDHDCHAAAITVARRTGPRPAAAFVERRHQGRSRARPVTWALATVPDVHQHNSALECTADHVDVGPRLRLLTATSPTRLRARRLRRRGR